MTQYDKLFKVIEKTIKEKLPGVIKVVFEKCGVDTLTAVESLNNENIKEMENNINSDDALLDAVKQCPGYTDQKFAFLIGHKILMKEVARKMSEIRNQGGLSRYKKGQCDRTNVEDNGNLDEQKEEIQNSLVQKVQNFCDTKDIDMEEASISKRSIKNFIMTTGKGFIEAKCSMECPICGKFISVLFKKYWYISNLERHIKFHVNTSLIVEEIIGEADQEANTY